MDTPTKRFLVHPPKLAKSTLIPFDQTSVNNEETYAFYAFINKAGEQAKRSHVMVDHCTVNSCSFSDCEVDYLSLCDMRIDHCEAVSSRLSQSFIERVEISNSKWMGGIITDSTLEHVVFRDCNLNLTSFGLTKFKKVEFRHCMLRQSKFLDCDITDVRFFDCDLTQLQLSGVRAEGVDFRSNDLTELLADPLELKGAIISPAQAIMLMSRFGIEVS